MLGLGFVLAIDLDLRYSMPSVWKSHSIDIEVTFVECAQFQHRQTGSVSSRCCGSLAVMGLTVKARQCML